MERLDEWMVFDQWEVEAGQRVIFANKPDRGFLVDFTIAGSDAERVIGMITSKKWTNRQLMEYLNVLNGEASPALAESELRN
ncbi:MAG TPA: hypothetical protein VN611_05655 [Patescibacteria group bacterium]|nr:hypothetical protein [Patescibacteria group bacterium]